MLFLACTESDAHCCSENDRLAVFADQFLKIISIDLEPCYKT